MKNILAELEDVLHTEIPLTNYLAIGVKDYDGEALTLKAPLAPNINHKDTAFAGSLNALVTLTGWSLLWLVLKELELEGKIVIQDSTINYLLPVTQDFNATCHKPDPALLAKFVKTLTKKRLARLELTAEISENGKTAVFFRGRYVVQLV